MLEPHTEGICATSKHDFEFGFERSYLLKLPSHMYKTHAFDALKAPSCSPSDPVATEGRATSVTGEAVWKWVGTTTKVDMVLLREREVEWGMSLASHSTTLALKPRGLCLGE
jgi:hypothetical protein